MTKLPANHRTHAFNLLLTSKTTNITFCIGKFGQA